MSSQPWARERAAYLMAHSRTGTSARRRAEILARAARRGLTAGTGVGASPVQDELTPEWWRRVLGKEDRGVGVKALIVAAWAVAAAVVGPGVVVGRYAIYPALLRLAPRIGRLWAWPWLAVGGIAVVVRWVFTDWPWVGVSIGLDRYIFADLVITGRWWAWLQWQLAVAALTVGWAVWAWGWKAVPRKAVAPPAKRRDGSWRTDVDVEKAKQLDPYAGTLPDTLPAAEDLDADDVAYQQQHQVETLYADDEVSE